MLAMGSIVAGLFVWRFGSHAGQETYNEKKTRILSSLLHTFGASRALSRISYNRLFLLRAVAIQFSLMRSLKSLDCDSVLCCLPHAEVITVHQ